MLLICLFSAVLVVLLAIDEIRIRRREARIRELERSLEMWKLAAEVYSDEAQRKSLDAMS